MALVFDADIAAGANSGDLTVPENTAVSVNADGPFRVQAKNGTDPYVTTFSTESPPYASSFIATSDTIRVVAVHGAIHASVYDNT